MSKNIKNNLTAVTNFSFIKNNVLHIVFEGIDLHRFTDK